MKTKGGFKAKAKHAKLTRVHQIAVVRFTSYFIIIVYDEIVLFS